MRTSFLFPLLLWLALFAGIRPISVPEPTSSNPPGNVPDGTRWTDPATLRTYTYSESLNVYLGELRVWNANKRSADVSSGTLRFGETASNNAVPYMGPIDVGELRIMEVYASSFDIATTVACTLRVWGDASSILKLAWTANDQRFVPTADSSGGWVPTAAVGDSVTIPADENVTVSVDSSTIDPDFPMIWIHVREEKDPS